MSAGTTQAWPLIKLAVTIGSADPVTPKTGGISPSVGSAGANAQISGTAFGSGTAPTRSRDAGLTGVAVSACGQSACRRVERDALAPGKPYDLLADWAVKGPDVILPVRTDPARDDPIVSRGKVLQEEEQSVPSLGIFACIDKWPCRLFWALEHLFPLGAGSSSRPATVCGVPADEGSDCGFGCVLGREFLLAWSHGR